jgi:hypothetical protein
MYYVILPSHKTVVFLLLTLQHGVLSVSCHNANVTRQIDENGLHVTCPYFHFHVSHMCEANIIWLLLFCSKRSWTSYDTYLIWF